MTTQAAPPRALTQQDLNWLVCPVCNQPLHLQATHAACTACNRLYPIIDGLPVLLPNRAA